MFENTAVVYPPYLPFNRPHTVGPDSPQLTGPQVFTGVGHDADEMTVYSIKNYKRMQFFIKIRHDPNQNNLLTVQRVVAVPVRKLPLVDGEIAQRIACTKTQISRARQGLRTSEACGGNI